MAGTRDDTLLKRQGANFLSIINDLKRNRKAAAKDLDVPLETVEKIIRGEIDIPQDVIARANRVWPVNKRDFMVVEDDAPEGVVLMKASDSESTSRVFARGGNDYYEYRDTAMSRVTTFRPEWILELCTVDDDSPDNPKLKWNNGHFMHQFTMFVNGVNFYYLENNERKVMTANTGDSMYITPFVPHTFGNRKKDCESLYNRKKGLILALTYGNKLIGDVQQELSVLPQGAPEQYLYETSSRERYFVSLLKQQMESLTMSRDGLLSSTRLDGKAVDDLLEGRRLPSIGEYESLAALFNINVRDLMPPEGFDRPVVTSYIKDAKPRKYNHYTLFDLASIRYLPYSKGLILECDSGTEKTDLRVPLHQYGYNFGEAPLRLRWEHNGLTHDAVVHPDDSIYIKPHVPHSFSALDGKKGRLLSLRIGGKSTGDPQREMSHIGQKNLHRVYREETLWYKEE